MTQFNVNICGFWFANGEINNIVFDYKDIDINEAGNKYVFGPGVRYV